MLPLRKAFETVRDEGVDALVRKSGLYLKYRYMIARSELGGGYTITSGGSSSSIRISTVIEASTLSYILRAEREFLDQVLSELETDDVVWDVGANIGVHTCLFSERAGAVVSFEPYPPNVERLRRNVAVSDNANVDVLAIALSDRDGTEALSVPESAVAGDQWPALLPDDLSSSRRGRLANTERLAVEVRTGDSLIEEGVRPPDVVKIDVEGASMKVLRGMREALERDRCRLVFVEVHLPYPDGSRPSVEDFGGDPAEVKRQLERYGFETSTVLERENDVFVRGEK